MLTAELLPPGKLDLEALDRFDDRLFSQRWPWLTFLASFTGGDIVVAALCRGHDVVGYASGVRFLALGMIPVLGSPFRGWTTPYIGFNLRPGSPRGEALAAFTRLAFGELGCVHLELSDRYLAPEEATRRGYAVRPIENYRTDLTQSEERIFASMTSACRRAIRKADKSGLVVEEAEPAGFAAEYHAQLRDVFGKQRLRPTYSCARVERLIEHVHPSGNLLLARVREPGGRSIATGIYPGFGRAGFLWGNGSLREYQILRPNEALHWFALRYWRRRGMREFDWGGAGDAGSYKAKYGGTPFTAVAVRMSRFRLVQLARDTAERAYYWPRQLQRRRYEAGRAAG